MDDDKIKEKVIEEQMKGVKFKKCQFGTTNYSSQPGQDFERIYVDGHHIGDWGFHKTIMSDYKPCKKRNYTVTHIPSGKAVLKNIDLIKKAKELTYRFYLSDIKWDGKGEMPKGYSKVGMDVLNKFKHREPIK